MSVTVYIPTPFRRLAGNQVYVRMEGSTVAEVLDNLSNEYPALRHMVFDESDEVPGHINIYVNNQEIHTLQGKETPLADGDEIAVIPAIAGGQVLTEEQVTRYSRHIIMPQVGPLGQRKLMAAKVLVIGVGGLGSPSALYLTLAGVGTIGIVDFDVVDLSNLQRQFLHQNDDVGRPKTQSAKETLLSYNPDVNVVIHNGLLTSENAMEIIPQYDIVITGADNFTTRYLVNDACYFAGKPLVDGSILIFDGQATVFIPGQAAIAACSRCRPRRGWSPVAPRPASWVPCPGSSAPFRPSRR